jgi:hypothetical protein
MFQNLEYMSGYLHEGERSCRDVEALKAKADSFAQSLSGIVRPLLEAGLSLRKVAERLNAEGIVTAQGKAWQANSVKRLADRLAV